MKKRFVQLIHEQGSNFKISLYYEQMNLYEQYEQTILC